MIFIEIKNSIKNEIAIEGSRANRKYITFFSLFTLIPSILISVFSLFLFSFALEKYFDKKITTAVSNSYQLAVNYVSTVRNKVESDIVMAAFDLNKNVSIYNENKQRFENYLNSQRIVRKLDAIFLIDNSGKLLMSTDRNQIQYVPPSTEQLKMVLNDERPTEKYLNAYKNTSAALMKLTNFNNTYIYIIKYLDPKISQYFN
jgi:Signal transduction histidine kinase involved in nitrogen fixation and metabolism regulation